MDGMIRKDFYSFVFLFIAADALDVLSAFIALTPLLLSQAG